MSKTAIVLAILSPIIVPVALAILIILILLSIPPMFLAIGLGSAGLHDLADQIWELVPIELVGRLVRKILS